MKNETQRTKLIRTLLKVLQMSIDMFTEGHVLYSEICEENIDVKLHMVVANIKAAKELYNRLDDLERESVDGKDLTEKIRALQGVRTDLLKKRREMDIEKRKKLLSCKIKDDLSKTVDDIRTYSDRLKFTEEPTTGVEEIQNARRHEMNKVLIALNKILLDNLEYE